MADITNEWNKSMPSGTSLVAQGDDLLRQHWTSIQSTIQQEHHMADSTASAGVHKPGSARLFYGLESSVSTQGNDDTEGRLMYGSDSMELYMIGSSNTTTVGRKPFVGIKLRKENQGIASGAALDVQFDEEVFNFPGGTGTQSLVTSNGTQIKIASGGLAFGYYQINAQLYYSAATVLGANTYIDLDAASSGVVDLGKVEISHGSAPMSLNLSTAAYFTAGNYITMRIFQNSGSRWTIDNLMLSAVRLG